MAVFSIDFDATCVKHEYPLMGRDLPHAERVLNRLLAEGHRLVLDTMRSGKELEEAVDWFKKRKLHLLGVQKNPGQETWTSSTKVWATHSIDDRNIGVPLVEPEDDRPYVDWLKVEKILEGMGLLKETE